MAPDTRVSDNSPSLPSFEVLHNMKILAGKVSYLNRLLHIHSSQTRPGTCSPVVYSLRNVILHQFTNKSSMPFCFSPWESRMKREANQARRYLSSELRYRSTGSSYLLALNVLYLITGQRIRVASTIVLTGLEGTAHSKDMQSCL